jgi:N-acyl-D-amino-acid deacylase
MFDVLIRDGWVLDGTGAPAFLADVAVSGDRIAGVGRFPAAAAEVEIDATDRMVAPGFVDTHVHGDGAITRPDVQLAALSQGITTFVLGQDGVSYAPAGQATLAYVSRYFAAVNGRHETLGEGPVSVAGLLESYAGSTALNAAYLLPHGTIRYEVMGAAARPAGEVELATMERLVRQGLDEGAAGLSSGLEYAPGRYADARELAVLAAPAAERGLPYVSHMRGYGPNAGAAFAELREVAETSGVPVHASHFSGPAGTLAALVDDARAAGVDATFDSYPYLRASTILSMATLPPWLPLADLDGTLEALAEPGAAARLEAEWAAGCADLWPRLTLAHVPAADYAWTEGIDLASAAERAGMPAPRLCRELLLATALAAGCVITRPDAGGTAEESMRALLRHPAHVGGSDGIYVGGHPHPRGYGAFARLLGRHVRELGDWTWEQAAVHLAAHPARRFGLADRGVLRHGMAADVVVFDPATVRDEATYDRPTRLAAGVEHVLVNGRRVLTGGTLTGDQPGRPLRPGAAAAQPRQ